MAGLDKMFGQDRAKKWKQDHAQHISQYNKAYFQEKKPEILEKRKIRRQSIKAKRNDFLGF